MRKGTVVLILLLLLGLAALGGGWKWTHGPNSNGTPTAVADDPSLPDGWTWDT
jgi:hypothetical protein